MNRLTKALIGAVVGLSVLVGLVGTSFAADPPGTPTPQTRQWQRGPMAGTGTGRGIGPGFQTMSGPIAELLGMSAVDIQVERWAGKSLAEIAKAKGIDETKLIATILAARKSALDARVQAGTLTREQADAAYQQMETRVKDSINRTEIGPNPAAKGLGLGWGRAVRNGNGQPGQGFGPGMFNRYGPALNR